MKGENVQEKGKQDRRTAGATEWLAGLRMGRTPDAVQLTRIVRRQKQEIRLGTVGTEAGIP